MKNTQSTIAICQALRLNKLQRHTLMFCAVLLMAFTYGLIVAHAQAPTFTANDAGQLEFYLNNAPRGSTIKLIAGQTYERMFKLPNRSCAVPNNCADSDYITITSTGVVPQAGMRVSPQMASASQMNFPKIVSPGSNQEAIATDPGAHHFRFIGVEIVSKNDNQQLSNLISLGEGVGIEGRYNQDSLEKVPHHLTFDRCYIRANDGQAME